MLDVYILAGGKSRRMGTDKAAMVVDGEPLLRRAVRASRHLGRVHIVGGDSSLLSLLDDNWLTTARNGEPAVEHRPDPPGDPGPFGAIVSAVGNASSEVVVLSCDLPRIAAADVDRLVAARRTTNADIAVPLVGGRRQWHAIVFAGSIIPDLHAKHRAGVRSLHSGFSGHRECAVVSADSRFFADVDTPEDVRSLS